MFSADGNRFCGGELAKGKTIGGNLTLVRSTLGTPFEIDTKDKILFLEEVREDPQTVDRLLTDLLNAGKFQEVAAQMASPNKKRVSFVCLRALCG